MERKKLTASFVESLTPPIRGEKWISDTILPGFGIRLWGGKTQGKSFAIRVNIGSKKIIRRTLSPAKGVFLKSARIEAEREIKDLKMGIERYLLKQKIKSMTFAELAEYALQNQENANRSIQYIDDNRKRFDKFTPILLQQKKAIDVTANEIESLLNAIEYKPAQQKNLRSFIHYMFLLAENITSERRFSVVLYYLKQIKIYTKKYEELASAPELTKDDFNKLFNILENEQAYVQKASFIHLLFLSGLDPCPSRLLRATWDEFDIPQENDSARVLWMPKGKTKEKLLRSGATKLLQKIKKRNETDFPDSPYLFPSSIAWKTGHITSYENYWGSIHARTGLPSISLYNLIFLY
ncbi:MAG: hypothetical protein K0R63_824 [Rickettsiales bacterium]|jgi:hypothetical protein|nr:hypothetical protein [Rickettsiales bacterium]